MAGLNALHVAAFNAGVEITLNANQANAELIASPVMQRVMSRDAALGSVLAMADATAANIATIDVAAVVGAATAEGSDAAATTLTTALIPNPAARQSITFDLGDSEDSKFRLGALWGPLNTIARMNLSLTPTTQQIQAMGVLGAAGVWGVLNRIAVQVKALASGFATTSGVALNVYSKALFQAAVDSGFAAGNRGESLWIDNDSAWNSVSADYAAGLGAAANSAGARIAIDRGPGQVTGQLYRGCSHATVTGLPVDGLGSTYGMIVWEQALTITTATPQLIEGAILVGVIGDPSNPIATIEMRRTAGGTTRFTITFWTGISERQDLGGIKTYHAT